MSRAKQLRLFDMGKPRLAHGGGVAKGRRKEARPFVRDLPMHIVMRSSLAHGEWSLQRKANEARIEELIDRLAVRFHIKVYKDANSGSHLHVVAQAHQKKDFQDFLRVLAGQIAQAVTGARRGAPRKFWDEVTYTRVVSWAELQDVLHYVERNTCETKGLIAYRPRRTPAATARLRTPQQDRVTHQSASTRARAGP
jgi:hypothetical protein